MRAGALIAGALVAGGLLGGCKKQLAPTSPYTDLVSGEVWREYCPGGVPEQIWIRFHQDGTFEWTESLAEGYRREGGERWRLQGTELLIQWDGSDATLYTFPAGGADKLAGASTKMNCRDRAELLAGE